jgi:putative colanic acid biosynthesis acetyltransferase WcaF
MALTTHDQSAVSRGASPWTLRQRLGLLAWEYVWMALCIWTPKPFYKWRLLVLKTFGAQIEGTPFVHQRARIQIPWNLTLGAEASLGDRTNVYNLGPVIIERRAVIGQEAYLCTGTHDLSLPSIPLQTAPIHIGADAFLGARAFIMPGVRIGERAIVGACSVVTKNVAPGVIVKGNPAR